VIRTAIVRIRRGEGWTVKDGAEAMDGRTVEVSHGWEITEDDSSIYVGETAWVVERSDRRGDEPSWIASGDLEFADEHRLPRSDRP